MGSYVDGKVCGLINGSVPRETTEVTAYLSQVRTDIRTRHLTNISHKGSRYRFSQIPCCCYFYIALLFCEELQHRFYIRQIGQI